MQESDDSQCIYLDTMILIGFYEKKDLGKHSRKIVNKIEKIRRNHRITAKVPVIVLGEFLAKMMHRDEDILEVLRKLNPEITGVSEESLTLALNLLERDKRIEADDALIVAMAITDRKATRLITTDSKLIGNRAIQEAIKERESKLKISDGI